MSYRRKNTERAAAAETLKEAFKVGDWVLINTSPDNGVHEFKNKLGRVNRLEESGNYRVRTDPDCRSLGWFKPNELSPVPNYLIPVLS